MAQPAPAPPALSSESRSGSRSQRLLRLGVSGATAGACTKTLIAPLERMKVLYQISGSNGSLRSVLGNTLAEDGFWGLWRGNSANVLRIIPNYALKFTLNDEYKKMLVGKGEQLADLGPARLMLAGSVAGMTQISFSYPLETVRTRMSLTASLRGTSHSKPFTSIGDCVRATIRSEGVRGLYKGMGVSLLTGSPYVGLQMTVYEMGKRWIPINDPVYLKLVAGSVAGIIAQTVLFPGDTVRRRMQTDGMCGAKPQYSGVGDCVRQVYRQGGIQMFFRGSLTNVIRAVPGAAIQFSIYEYLKEKFVR